MSVTAQTVAELIAAGLEGDALVAALRRIEEASHVTSQRSAGALRTERWRTKSKASQTVTVTSQSVTSDEPTIEGSSKEEEGKKDSIGGSRHKPSRRAIKYTPVFETFWKAYPTDPGMGKAETFAEWERMTDDDRSRAVASIPAFKAWVAKQGQTYRTKHAVNYLKARRFEGFVDAEAQSRAVMEAAPQRVYVKYGTDAGDAWEQDYRLKGKVPPRDQHGGWHFPTEYPQPVDPRATSEAA